MSHEPLRPEDLPLTDWQAVEVDEAPPSQDPPLQQVEVQDDDDADE